MSATIYQKNEAKYVGMYKKGLGRARIVEEMLEDELVELESREREVDRKTRAFVEKVIEYGAQELGIAPPRVIFFDSKGFSAESGTETKGVFNRKQPDEIWVASDMDWWKQGETALHELAHAAEAKDYAPGALSPEQSERSADQFEDRGRRIGWVRSAARAVGA